MSKKNRNEIPAPSPESMALPCVGVESHAHLDMKHFVEDLDAVLKRAKICGVSHIGQVFLSPEAWGKGKALFPSGPEYPVVFFLLGIHPTDGLEFTQDTIANMKCTIGKDPRIKAVGEIGLDYYWDNCPKDVQREIFIKQLNMSREVKLPVAIHCRDAVDDTLAILDEQGFVGEKVLWHCFNGNIEHARKILDRGWYLSIPGPVSFPGSHELREAVSFIPKNRIMVETDCPYMAPVPYRGKRNEPAYLVFTIRVMAEAVGITPEEFWQLCGDNARLFFGL